MVMEVHTRDLRYFLAIADEGNFTTAAARLYVSQPALSKQIRTLERHLRVQLFVRDRNGARLTQPASSSSAMPARSSRRGKTPSRRWPARRTARSSSGCTPAPGDG